MPFFDFKGDRKRVFAYTDALTINPINDYRDILGQQIRYTYLHCLKVSFELIIECGQESKNKSQPLGAPPCTFLNLTLLF